MKFTKLQAIEEMEEIGSHTIFLEGSEELVNNICEPFGSTPVWTTFTPDRNSPKGAQPTWDDKSQSWDWSPFRGVDGFHLAHQINRACQGKATTAFGRGFTYREDLRNAKATLG